MEQGVIFIDDDDVEIPSHNNSSTSEKWTTGSFSQATEVHFVAPSCVSTHFHIQPHLRLWLASMSMLLNDLKSEHQCYMLGWSQVFVINFTFKFSFITNMQNTDSNNLLVVLTATYRTEF